MNRRQIETLATFISEHTDVGYIAGTDIAEALVVDGWVMLRAESVRRAQQRLDLAKHREQWANTDAESSRNWAHEAFREQRRLAERCTFLYGAAIAAGAAPEELNHP